VNGNSAAAATATAAAAPSSSSSSRSSNSHHLSLHSKRAVEMLLRFGEMGTIDTMPQVHIMYIHHHYLVTIFSIVTALVSNGSVLPMPTYR
jgi:hypothetical protein